jgi:hypothetical protein
MSVITDFANISVSVLDRTLITYVAPVLLALYILTFFGPLWALGATILFVILSGSFEPEFVLVFFISVVLADILVQKRLLPSGSYDHKMYLTVAVTGVLTAFFIMTISGALEPYQSFLIFFGAYILQARMRPRSMRG